LARRLPVIVTVSQYLSSLSGAALVVGWTPGLELELVGVWEAVAKVEKRRLAAPTAAICATRTNMEFLHFIEDASRRFILVLNVSTGFRRAV